MEPAPLVEPLPPAVPLPVMPPPPAVPVPLLEPPMLPEASIPEPVPMLSELMVDPVPEVPDSPTVLSVLLWQEPSSPVPSTTAAKNTEGFLVNIIVERLVGLLSYTSIHKWVTTGKPVFFSDNYVESKPSWPTEFSHFAPNSISRT